MSETDYRLTKLYEDGRSVIPELTGDGPVRDSVIAAMRAPGDLDPIQFKVVAKNGSMVAYFPWFFAQIVNFVFADKVQQFLTQDGEKMVNNGPAVTTLMISGIVPYIRVSNNEVVVDKSGLVVESADGSADAFLNTAIRDTVDPNLPKLFDRFYDDASIASIAKTGNECSVSFNGFVCFGAFVKKSLNVTSEPQMSNIFKYSLTFMCSRIITPYKYNKIQAPEPSVKKPTAEEKNARPAK